MTALVDQQFVAAQLIQSLTGQWDITMKWDTWPVYPSHCKYSIGVHV